MRLMLVILGTLFCFPAGAASSEPCKKDPRVRCTEYEADKIVEIVVDVGYHASVFLEKDEKITDKETGYPDGWFIKEFEGYSGFYLKAIKVEPDTNLTVVTDKRKYLFEIRMKEPEKTDKGGKMKAKAAEQLPSMYALKFRYGGLGAEGDSTPGNSEERKASDKREVERRLEEAGRKKYKNTNYWAQGSEAVTPSAAYDDGTFTYLNFPPNMDMPSVFLVDEDGEESLANKHMDRDTVVVEHVKRKLLLRRGKLVAALFNESYDQHGIENETKTVSSGVKRNLKQVEKPKNNVRRIEPAIRAMPAPIEERKVGEKLQLPVPR